MSVLSRIVDTLPLPREKNSYPRQQPDDVLELFSGHAAKRLIELRRQAAELRALAQLPGDELNSLYRRRSSAKNDRNEINGLPLGAPERQARLAPIDAELASIETDIADVQARKELRDQKAGTASGLVKACEDYALDHLLKQPAALHNEMVLAKPAKGESAAMALDRIRNTIADVKSDIADVSSASVPATVAKQIIRDHIAPLAAAGRIDVSDTLRRGGGKVVWPGTRNLHQDFDLQAVLAYLFEDLIIAKLEAEVDALADNGGMTDAECSTKLRALSAKLLDLERQEEEMFRLAESEGFFVTRCKGVDVRALLCLANSMPAPK